MIFATLKDALASGHDLFWAVGFDYLSDEAHTLYVDRVSAPSMEEACREVSAELNVEVTSCFGARRAEAA